MPLILTLKQQSPAPLEVEGILPQLLGGRSLAEVERLPVFEGNRQVPLAEFFTVAGDTADETIHLEGDLAGVHWIGAKMASGKMMIGASVGRHLGSQMYGGEIHVAGSAGDYAGCQMRGGTIHIRGSAGNLVGGAYRGSARGMRGGTIVVGGDAGDETGHTMRRGLIAVGGSAGDLPGFNMLSGSIVLCGRVGSRPGAGMKRGSIVVTGSHPPPLLPSFRRACRYRPETLSLIFRRLSDLGFRVTEEVLISSYDLFNGDLLAGGRGEILVRV